MDWHQVQRAARILSQTVSKTCKICWSGKELLPRGHPSLDCRGQSGLLGGKGISWSRAGHDHRQWSCVRYSWLNRGQCVVARCTYLARLGNFLEANALSRDWMKKTIGETKEPVMIFLAETVWTYRRASLHLAVEYWTSCHSKASRRSEDCHALKS